MKVPLAPSGLRSQDIKEINRVLDSGNLTMGEEVSSFEREMADYLGVKHFIMVNSGSSANLAMIEALIRPSSGIPKLKLKDKVMVPAIAWPTTVWPLIQLGLTPVFVDVDIETMAISLDCAQEILESSKERISGIFPIHPLGLGINQEALSEFCGKNELTLVEDVCESLGSWQKGFHTGTTGYMSSFSFYFSHHMTTMEGGGVATNNDEFANDLKSIRSHGWSRDRSDNETWSFEVHPSMRKFNFVSTGFNIRPMEIQAAVGRSQLKDLDSFVQKRRENVRIVNEALVGTKLEILGLEKESDILLKTDHSWMHIPIKINDKKIQEIDIRARIVRFLEDYGIETRPPLTGNFVKQPAMTRFGSEELQYSFPFADKLSKSVFLVGCHHDLSNEQINHLATKLRQAALDLL